MNRKYVVVAPPFLTTSAGVYGLHKLNSDLNQAGEQSRVIVLQEHGNSLEGATVSPDEIVIYPDCFRGNPLNATNVVRYLLMFAGYFHGTDKDFPASEYMYYYSPDFILNNRESDNILTIPVVDINRFEYKPDGRSGSCYLAIKYNDYFGLPVDNLPEGCIKITHETDLPKLFSTIKTLISYDNSAINLEAALCGIEIEYRFNSKFERLFDFGKRFGYSNVRQSYLEQIKRYTEIELPEFIKKTQMRFK